MPMQLINIYIFSFSILIYESDMKFLYIKFQSFFNTKFNSIVNKYNRINAIALSVFVHASHMTGIFSVQGEVGRT